jgi:hypothetical protein
MSMSGVGKVKIEEKISSDFTRHRAFVAGTAELIYVYEHFLANAAIESH